MISNESLKAELMSVNPGMPVDLIWCSGPADIPVSATCDACIDLLFDSDADRINVLNRLDSGLVIVNAVLQNADTLPDHFVRINGWNTFLQRNIVEAASKNENIRLKTEQVFRSFGKELRWVPDIKGFLTARVVACIINEAFYTLGENVSSRDEIDTAMKLGTNYPYGPFEWAEKIGLEQVWALLNHLSEEDSRYKPADLLKKSLAK